MKIGILTHQYINNYGAFLQAWALREAIAELFPNDEVQIIDYVNLKHFIINAGGWFRFYKNRESFKDWMEKIKLPRTFAKARNQEMILSKRCFNAKQICNQICFPSLRSIHSIGDKVCLSAIGFLEIILHAFAQNNDLVRIFHSIFFALVNKLRTKSRLPFLALPVDAMDGNHHPFAEHLGQP